MSFSRETAVKATRKLHRCDVCGCKIATGSPAVRWAGITDYSDFASVVMHVECREAEIAVNADNLYDWMRLDDDPGMEGLSDLVRARLGVGFAGAMYRAAEEGVT